MERPTLNCIIRTQQKVYEPAPKQEGELDSEEELEQMRIEQRNKQKQPMKFIFVQGSEPMIEDGLKTSANSGAAPIQNLSVPSSEITSDFGDDHHFSFLRHVPVTVPGPSPASQGRQSGGQAPAINFGGSNEKASQDIVLEIMSESVPVSLIAAKLPT